MRKPKTSLTQLEIEMIHMIASGGTTGEIAAQLRLPDSTVETYRHRLYHFMQVRNAPQLISVAYQIGILVIGERVNVKPSEFITMIVVGKLWRKPNQLVDEELSDYRITKSK